MTLLLLIAAMAANQSAGLARSAGAARLRDAWLADSTTGTPAAAPCEPQDLPGFSFSPVTKHAVAEAIAILKPKQIIPLDDASARRMLALSPSREPLAAQYFSSRLSSLRKMRERIILTHSGYWSPSHQNELDQMTKLVQSGSSHFRPYLARGLSGRYISVSLCGPNATVSSVTPGFPAPHTGLPLPVVFFTDQSPERVAVEWSIL
jgi:hypothetical protein